MKQFIFTHLLIILIFCFVENSFAVSFSEPPDFDWDNPTYIGILDLGPNTVSGQNNMDTSPSGYSYDHDGFYFTVGSGMALTSITISLSTDYTDYSNIYDNVAKEAWELTDFQNTSQLATSGEIDLLSVGTSPFELFPGFSGLGPGDYVIRDEYIGIMTGDKWVSDYTINLTTSQIPEPSTMLLFGLGIIGLAGMSRRNK